MDSTLLDVAVGGGSLGLGLAAGVRAFGVLADLAKHWLEERRLGRQESRADNEQAFDHAMRIIEEQQERITCLEVKLKEQDDKFRGQIEQLRFDHGKAIHEYQSRIVDLEKKVDLYERVLVSSPETMEVAKRFGLCLE